MIEQFKRRELNIKTLLTLLIVCLLTSLVKYAFLPIFVVVCIFAIVYGVMCLRGTPSRTILRESLQAISRRMLVSLVLLALLSSGLFIQRYGVNVVEYHTPIADCDQVLNYDHCSSYGPWLRNYQDAQSKTTVDTNLFSYVATWVDGLRYRLFFAINGPDQAYTNYPPLVIPFNTALVLAFVSLIALIVRARRVFSRQPFVVFVMIAALLYLAALFREDFEQYLDTSQPVAINGRYLLPVLPLLAIGIGRAFQQLLATHRRAWLKPLLAGSVLLLFLQGGGIMTFILRSDPSWDWPNRAVIDINNGARKILAPIIIEGSKYY